MGYKMWKKGRTTDYSFIDRNIAEQYNIGGVDMWLYAYVGPKQLKTNDDGTLSDGEGQSDVTKIGDLIFGEAAQREYNLEAITLSAVYQVQEATPDLKMPGIFFNFNTMDITVHYNTMMQRVGRKILPGDVIELPNLRDFDVIGKDSGLNRFYVVQDSFRTSEGYSVTWQHHIFKLRVKPLTDSPEYSAITGGDNNFPDNPDDPNNGSGNSDSNGGSENSNYNNEMDIMNRIIMQADDEVPYIHWTNEHIYNDRSDIWDLARVILNGYEFPEYPSPNMFFIKKTYPVLYEYENSTWGIVDVNYGTVFPKRPKDGDFFFKEEEADVSGFTLFQYNKDKKQWLTCDLPYTNLDKIPDDAEDFYVLYHTPQLYQVLPDGKTWVIPPDEHSNVPFTSKQAAANLTNPEDIRSKIPPARGTVGEGTEFPSDPEDGEYYYRTDYTPVTLWEYNDEKKSWVQFNYGGRQPWTGADKAKTDFVNSQNRVALEDAVKPNIVYRVHKK